LQRDKVSCPASNPNFTANRDLVNPLFFERFIPSNTAALSIPQNALFTRAEVNHCLYIIATLASARQAFLFSSAGCPQDKGSNRR
jgi:hypothetical protein